MNKKLIAWGIAIVTLLVPFRLAFVEHPFPEKINGNFYEPHPGLSMFYFLLTFAGTMIALYLGIEASSEPKKAKGKTIQPDTFHDKKAAA